MGNDNGNRLIRSKNWTIITERAVNDPTNSSNEADNFEEEERRGEEWESGRGGTWPPVPVFP